MIRMPATVFACNSLARKRISQNFQILPRNGDVIDAKIGTKRRHRNNAGKPKEARESHVTILVTALVTAELA